MKNSKLIKLLKTFDPKEIKRFSEFISAPYFNKNKNVIKLFEVLIKAYPDFMQEKIKREIIFSKIFPGKKYNSNTLRVLINYLYERAKDFLSYAKFGSDKNTCRFKEALLAELLDRELYYESVKTIDKSLLELEKSEERDSEYFLYKYVFENKKLYCLQRIHEEKYEKYFTKPTIETPLMNLINFFFNKVLTYYIVVLNMKILYKIEMDTALLERIFSYFDYELFKDSPLMQIYYNIVMILMTNDEKYLYEIKSLVLKYEKSLNPVRLDNIYVNMENYCLRKIRAGETHFRRELFEILKLDLEKKIYKYESDMPQKFYKNVFHNAVELKEFDWADEFIESYKNELRSDIREAVLYYCKAFIEAEKNNFEKSLDYLSKLKTDELYLKIDLKLLQARLYYELNEYDVLNSAIDSMKHFIKSNKFISENRKVQFSTFIKFLSALNNAQLKKDEYKIKELKENISKAEDLQWKEWFVKKVEELEAID